jgi:hypothetical protein
MNTTQRLLAIVATLFGMVTVVAGGRVLLGADPGYAVFRPLLAYNTAMGVAYIAAGVLAWFSVRRGTFAAATIFVLNGVVLAIVGYLYAEQGNVAIESVRAMTLRTVVWLVLFLGLLWLSRREGRRTLPDA